MNMVIVNKFGTCVADWLYDNGFVDASISFDHDFSYNILEKCINIGTTSYPIVSKWFEEFLQKLGCEWHNIPEPVLCFLHELGHYNTISDFSEDELVFFQFRKTLCSTVNNDGDYQKEGMFEYCSSLTFINCHMYLIEKICLPRRR